MAISTFTQDSVIIMYHCVSVINEVFLSYIFYNTLINDTRFLPREVFIFQPTPASKTFRLVINLPPDRIISVWEWQHNHI